MSEIAVRENAAQQLVAQVRQPDFREQIELALPERISVDRWTRVFVTALLENQDLVKADRASLFQASIRCAQAGLMPDGREAALVVYNTKVKDDQGERWIKKVQCLEMVQGYRKIAAEYGWIIRSAVVYENDRYEVEQGLHENLVHVPTRPGAERGKMIAAYAIGVHRDGRREFEPMTEEDIAKARASSRAASKGPWVDWPERMWEKTAVRRLFKKLSLDPADQRISALLDMENMDAVRALYGPAAQASAPPEPLGAPSTEHGAEPPSTSAAAGEGADEGTQQAEGAAPPQDLAALSAPGVDPEDIEFGEPLAGAEQAQGLAGDESGRLQESSSASAPAPASGEPEPEWEPDPQVVALADQAAGYVPPVGRYGDGRGTRDKIPGGKGPMTLAQISAYEREQGIPADKSWFPWALRSIDKPPDFRHALVAYSRVYEPAAYHAEMARREAA